MNYLQFCQFCYVKFLDIYSNVYIAYIQKLQFFFKSLFKNTILFYAHFFIPYFLFLNILSKFFMCLFNNSFIWWPWGSNSVLLFLISDDCHLWQLVSCHFRLQDQVHVGFKSSSFFGFLFGEIFFFYSQHTKVLAEATLR